MRAATRRSEFRIRPMSLAPRTACTSNRAALRRIRGSSCRPREAAIRLTVDRIPSRVWARRWLRRLRRDDRTVSRSRARRYRCAHPRNDGSAATAHARRTTATRAARLRRRSSARTYLLAWVDRGGRATDARASADRSASFGAFRRGRKQPTCESPSIARRYRPDEEIAVDAAAAGAQGYALMTFESAIGVEPRVVRTSGGHASARLRATDAAGELRVGAAFVRDGAIEWNTIPVTLDGAGTTARRAVIAGAASTFAPGETATAVCYAARRPGTFVVRHQPRSAFGQRALRVRRRPCSPSA